jgi:hypothetical protein
VVRSGRHIPVTFALRLPNDVSLDGRPLMISARFVHAHRSRLEGQKVLPAGGLNEFITLTLTDAKNGDR